VADFLGLGVLKLAEGLVSAPDEALDFLGDVAGYLSIPLRLRPARPPSVILTCAPLLRGA
jgi:hypothetical protein